MAIAAEKGLGAVAMAVGAVVALTHRGMNPIDPVQRLVAARLFDDPDSMVLRWIASHLPTLPVHVTLWFGLGLVLWALLFGAEAWGVWYGRVWGEMLVIVETAVFLPISTWRLATHPGLSGASILALNIVILILIVRVYQARRRAAREAAAAALAAAEEPAEGLQRSSTASRA